MMLLLGIVPALIVLVSGTYEIQEPYSLREFRNYADVHFSLFEIPDDANWALWTFILLTKTQHCEPANATVYVQQGGYPIFTPFNETFPPGFQSSSSYYLKLGLSTHSGETQQLMYMDPMPRSGKWFVASFLNPDSQPNAIRPPGFSGESCNHYIRVSLTYETEPFYIDEPFPLNSERTYISDVDNNKGILKFFIPKHVYEYNVTVKGCKALVGDNCTFDMLIADARGPTKSGGDHVNSTCMWPNTTGCQLRREQPVVNHWHYASITHEKNTSLAITIIVTTKGCVGGSAAICQVNELYLDTLPGEPYTANFLSSSDSPSLSKVTGGYIVRDDKPYVSSLTIQSLVHSGGTLNYLIKPVLPLSNNRAIIYSCIMRDKLLTNHTDIKSCAKSQNNTMEYSAGSKSSYSIPYPQSGTWYESLLAECYDPSADKHTIVDCTETIFVQINATLRPCINKSCGKYGTCYQYYSGIIHWSVCKCKAGYRGYGCTDASVAQSDSMQLLETLLLTLSNIVFAVAGAWAIYRKWFSEALVYFFVLLASTFYHACDNGTIYTLCVVDYAMLQYCDFYGSILAVWMTAMAMSDLPDKLRAFLHVAGVLGILIGSQFSLVGLWNFLIPLLIGAVILATSWVRMCRVDMACYPKIKVWLIQVLPGVVLALIGLMLYSFAETEANYFYVHSIWHILMASAILCLLPRHKTLNCTSVKDFVCKIKMKRRRNSMSDQIEAGDNRNILIDDSTERDSTEASTITAE